MFAAYKDELIEEIRRVDEQELEKAALLLLDAYHGDRQVFIMGNGDSAGTANHFVCDFGKNAVHIPDGKVQRMQGDYIGKEVLMGIRPENINDSDAFTATYPDACIDVHVDMTEQMGSETYLYLTTDGKEGCFIARVDPRTNSRGGCDITVGFDVNRLHFFDAETEMTILSRN